MSEPTPRLNLIQRAMQRTALSRTAVPVDNGALKKANGQPKIASAAQKEANNVPSQPHWKAEPAQIAREAELVHFDYAKLRSSRIVTPDNTNSATYNEFRSLKRKLIPMTRDRESGTMTSNVVMVTSALPREGKTFTVMNLAICLAAERNSNVILVDGDVVRGSISDYFHGENQDGLVDLLTEKRQRIADLLHPCADLPGLHVLFAGSRHQAASELLASHRMANICSSLSKHFEQSIVLFDTPPVLATSETPAIAAHAHHLIMLVASGQSGRHQVVAALEEVSRCPSISLLFNRSSQWLRPLSEPYYYKEYGHDKSQEA